MSRYSDEQREAIIEASRAALERADATREAAAPPEPVVEDRLTRWRREADQQEARFRLERRAVLRREVEHETAAPVAPIDWNTLDDRINAAVAAAVDGERERTSQMLARVIAEIRAEATDDLERATRALTVKLGEVRVALGEVQLTLATERAAAKGIVLDLPNPIARRTN
jgi:hypothetical protein